MERLDLAGWRLSVARRLKGFDLPVLSLACVVILAPLALGAVHLATQVACAAVALIGFIALTFRLRAREANLRLGLIGIGFVVALLATFLQWLPLPWTVVEALAPESTEARQIVADLLGSETSSLVPISLDRSRTAVFFVTLVGYTSVFLLAANLNDHLQRMRLVGGFVQWAGLVVAGVGLVHAALGAEHIYGVYRASISLDGQMFMTSFVNPNHAAALMLLSACISFGLWVSSKDPVATKFHFLAAGTLLLAVCATGSRACIALALMSLVGIAAWASFGAKEPESKTKALRGAVAMILGLILIVLLFAPPKFLQGLIDDGNWQSLVTDEHLLERWTVGLQLADRYWLSGTGAGAFGMAATDIMTQWSGGMVTYAHNFILQAVSDWGLLVAGVIGLLMTAGAWGVLTRARWRPECVGLGAGVGLLALQNLVDFSFLIPGVGYAFMASAGFLVGHVIRLSPSQAERKEWWKRPSVRWRHAYSLVLVGIFSLCAVHGWSHASETWRAEAQQALHEDKPGRLELEVMLEEHPRDFYLMSVASFVASESGREQLASRLLDRALELAPHATEMLLRRARYELQQKRPDTAKTFILRLANEGAVGRRAAVRLVLEYARFRKLSDAFFSDDEANVRLGVEQLRQKGLNQSVEHLLAWSLSTYPKSTWVREELASIWVYKQGKEDALDALSINMLAESVNGEESSEANQLRRTGYMIQGYLLKRKGRLNEAYHMFTEAALLDPERSTKPLLESGDLLAKMGELERLDAVIADLEVQITDAPLIRGPFHVLKSRSLEAHGKVRPAINEMQRAILYLKHQEVYYTRLAALYDSIGDKTSALNVRERLDKKRRSE